MSFILLRRTTDGEIHLLSNTSWSGRGDAMAELSRITGAPAFDRWDDEVLLVDIDSGTPILMVRPATTEVVVEEPAPQVAPADAEAPDAMVASEVPAEPAEPADDAPEAEDDVVPVAIDTTDADPTTTDDSSEDASDDVLDDSGEPAQPSLSADDEIAALLEDLDTPEDVEPAAPSLKEALARSAARLEAEGIVAPESVGPAPETAPSEPEDAAAIEPGPALDEAPAVWPWDTAPEEKAFDLDAYEESHDQSDSLVRAPGDDETLSFAKPVILGGEYADVAPEAVDEAPAPTEAVETTSMGSSAAPTAPGLVAEPDATDSDFIDLGTAEPAAPAPMVSDELAALTCADCVYDATCPNRGQLLPASCGSFQWK